MSTAECVPCGQKAQEREQISAVINRAQAHLSQQVTNEQLAQQAYQERLDVIQGRIQQQPSLATVKQYR